MRKCKSCGTEYEGETTEDYKKYFYEKKTHSGTYLLKECKKCVTSKHREKYSTGKYNWYKRHTKDYSRPISVGKDLAFRSSCAW